MRGVNGIKTGLTKILFCRTALLTRSSATTSGGLVIVFPIVFRNVLEL